MCNSLEINLQRRVVRHALSHLQSSLPLKYVTQNSSLPASRCSKCQIGTHPDKWKACRLIEPRSINIQDHILSVCLPCGYLPKLFRLYWLLFFHLKQKLLETLTLYTSHHSLFLPLGGEGGFLSGESICRTRGGEEWHSTHRSPTQPRSAPDGKLCYDGRSAWQDGEAEWWGPSITAKALSARLNHFFPPWLWLCDFSARPPQREKHSLLPTRTSLFLHLQTSIPRC